MGLLLIATPQPDLVTFEMRANQPTCAKPLHVGARQLNAARAIHDQELVRDHLARLLEPASLGARAPVTDLDHAIGMPFDAGVVSDDDSGRP
jgi:hypothetical protein